MTDERDGAGANAPADRQPFVSAIGSSTSESITTGGRDLASELMGRVTLTELAYLLLTKREATAGQRRILDTVLVSLADHGLTPSALAARLTITGAPEALQGAVAAGLLGAGSVLLGPAGDTAQFLADALAAHHVHGTGSTGAAGAAVSAAGGSDLDEATLATLAASIVGARLASGARVPGLGHPIHREQDPRTPRLYEVAREEGLLGPHLRLLEHVAVACAEQTGRRLPINGAGAGGAALADVGVPPGSVRGFVLIARTAGLVAHLAEEAEHPLGPQLWLDVDRRTITEAQDPDQDQR